MSDIKWIKITTDIFDDEKMKLIDSLPESDALIVIWFKLLTLAGKVNDSGSIYISKKMPITDEMLSTIFNRQLNTVRLALNTFVEFGMITVEDHINITNWEKHQNVDKMTRIKEQNVERQRRHRDKVKEIPQDIDNNVIVTLRNATDKIRLDKIRLDKNIKHIDNFADRFIEFWEDYPKKIGKGAAEKSYKKINPSQELQEKIIEAVKTAKQSQQWIRDNGQFIPNPATWLNQKRWEDELQPNGGNSININPQMSMAQKAIEMLRSKQDE